MTQIASVYAQALYDLAKDKSATEQVLSQLQTLQQSISEEPDFLRLLSTPALSKEERCRIIDDCFSGKLHPYILNFMKILVEKGYARHFPQCCDAFEALYNLDHGILVVTASTAFPLTADQLSRLSKKLETITGKQIRLRNYTDETVLGGIRLDYDGKQLDDTLQHRLDDMAKLLKNTVL